MLVDKDADLDSHLNNAVTDTAAWQATSGRGSPGLFMRSLIFVTKDKDFSNRVIGIINFERLSPNFIADTMNWFLNSMLD